MEINKQLMECNAMTKSWTIYYWLFADKIRKEIQKMNVSAITFPSPYVDILEASVQ